jgi:hypothetical protein
MTQGGAIGTSLAGHNVLSATHLDVVAASLVRGDILYVNSTPKLARLAVGAANKFVGSDGTDTSWTSPKMGFVVQIVADGTDDDTSSGVMTNLPIPLAMNGMNLIRATAHVSTAGTTNATTVQVRNMTKYASNDALSGAISIASGGTVATAGTVNTSYDDVATDDRIKIYVTGQSTTKPKGLYVVLEYALP